MLRSVALVQLKQASKAKDFIDLSQQEVSEESLRVAVGLPAGNDHEVDEHEIPGEHDDNPDAQEPVAVEARRRR